jgi:hypothetical protein
MSDLPELTDDATIIVAREGGMAFIPGLRAERRFMLGDLPPPERERVCHALQQAMPLGEPEEKAAQVGSGDQLFSHPDSVCNAPRGRDDSAVDSGTGGAA